MIFTEPPGLSTKDLKSIVKENPTRAEIEIIKNKWIIPSNPERVCLITDYWAINEPGYAPRLDYLANTNGTVIGVGASDRFLSLTASLQNPEGGVLIELNPYFTEVGIPYYAEAILASEGNIEKLSKFFAENDELLLGLFDLAYEVHSKKQPLNPNLQHSLYNRDEFLREFKECRDQNQRYLGKHSWTQNAEVLNKLYELIKASKIKGYTADAIDLKSWQTAMAALESMGVQGNPSVIDISNIHQERGWAQYGTGRNLGLVLSQTFSLDATTPIVLGSGIINSRRPFLLVESLSGKESLASVYQNDPVFGSYYQDKCWSSDITPNKEGLPSAWISHGIWPLVKNAKKPL